MYDTTCISTSNITIGAQLVGVISSWIYGANISPYNFIFSPIICEMLHNDKERNRYSLQHWNTKQVKRTKSDFERQVFISDYERHVFISDFGRKHDAS